MAANAGLHLVSAEMVSGCLLNSEKSRRVKGAFSRLLLAIAPRKSDRTSQIPWRFYLRREQ
jgi:hypothetical protein